MDMLPAILDTFTVVYALLRLGWGGRGGVNVSDAVLICVSITTAK